MKTTMIVMIVVAGLLFGCYGYGRPPVYQPAVSPLIPPVAAAMSMVPMGSGGYFLPPAPPPDLMFVNGHGYPQEWDGPNRLLIINNSHYYVRVRMDGTEMAVTDQGAALPLLPPGQTAYIFLPFDRMGPNSDCERHSLEFEGYLLSSLDRPVARDSRERCFSPSRGDGSTVEISNLCFAGYC